MYKRSPKKKSADTIRDKRLKSKIPRFVVNCVFLTLVAGACYIFLLFQTGFMFSYEQNTRLYGDLNRPVSIERIITELEDGREYHHGNGWDADDVPLNEFAELNIPYDIKDINGYFTVVDSGNNQVIYTPDVTRPFVEWYSLKDDFKGPHSIEQNGDGSVICVTDTENNRVVFYTQNGPHFNRIKEFTGVSGRPHYVVWMNNKFYVWCADPKTVTMHTYSVLGDDVAHDSAQQYQSMSGWYACSFLKSKQGMVFPAGLPTVRAAIRELSISGNVIQEYPLTNEIGGPTMYRILNNRHFIGIRTDVNVKSNVDFVSANNLHDFANGKYKSHRSAFGEYGAPYFFNEINSVCYGGCYNPDNGKSALMSFKPVEDLTAEVVNQVAGGIDFPNVDWRQGINYTSARLTSHSGGGSYNIPGNPTGPVYTPTSGYFEGLTDITPVVKQIATAYQTGWDGQIGGNHLYVNDGKDALCMVPYGPFEANGKTLTYYTNSSGYYYRCCNGMTSHVLQAFGALTGSFPYRSCKEFHDTYGTDLTESFETCDGLKVGDVVSTTGHTTIVTKVDDDYVYTAGAGSDAAIVQDAQQGWDKKFKRTAKIRQAIGSGYNWRRP